MYPNREVFAESPLALVAAEIRFSDSARLRRQETLDEITLALEGRFPFAQPVTETNFDLNAGMQPQVINKVVLKTANNTESLTIMPGSVTYETTAYADFNVLIEAVVAACDAMAAAGVNPALIRVGLRYIDEVRVTDKIDNVRQWETWIDRRLIEHLDVGPEGVVPTTTQGFTTYDLGDGKGMNFRFAALNQSPVVTPVNLRRPAYEPGPFFVLDYDGFHTFDGEEATVLSAAVVGKSLSDVHVPCGTAFQRSITDEARVLFRGTDHTNPDVNKQGTNS